MIVKGVVRTEKAVNMASFRKTMAFIVVNTASTSQSGSLLLIPAQFLCRGQIPSDIVC